jgi:DNA mismatch endonuclease (patch repair protein)
MPKNNREWWQDKLGRNVERDREKDDLLTTAGWTVIHVWEHEEPEAAADRIEELWRHLCGRGRADDCTPR